MGMQTPTRRTASEINSLKTMGSARWSSLLRYSLSKVYRPMAQQMIQNTQGFMKTDNFPAFNCGNCDAIWIRPKVAARTIS